MWQKHSEHSGEARQNQEGRLRQTLGRCYIEMSDLLASDQPSHWEQIYPPEIYPHIYITLINDKDDWSGVGKDYLFNILCQVSIYFWGGVGGRRRKESWPLPLQSVGNVLFLVWVYVFILWIFIEVYTFCTYFIHWSIYFLYIF